MADDGLEESRPPLTVPLSSLMQWWILLSLTERVRNEVEGFSVGVAPEELASDKEEVAWTILRGERGDVDEEPVWARWVCRLRARTPLVSAVQTYKVR